MIVTLPYGPDRVETNIEWGQCLGVLEVSDTPPLKQLESTLESAFQTPVGISGPVLEGFSSGEKTVIVVSDSFRQTGIHLLLPTLLAALKEKGISNGDISFLVSMGTHRPPTEGETRKILGSEVYEAFQGQIFVHDAFDPEGLVELGTTSRGTKVSLNKRYVNADRRIVTGSVVLHYFAGFGGGRKAIVPGLSSEAAIAHNHALNLDPDVDRLNPDVRIGVCAGNPVAEDMLEAASFKAPDFIINTVLNQDQAIAGLFVGEMEAAHAAATAFALDMFAVPIEQKADFVIASAGTAKNFLQSHKALFNAFQAIKPGGRIIFLAQAPEGLGGNKLASWLSLGGTSEIMTALRERAEINGQTALSTREKAHGAYFLTQLSESECALIGAKRINSLEEGVAACKRELEEVGVHNPSYYLMPAASQTVPTSLSPSVPL